MKTADVKVNIFCKRCGKTSKVGTEYMYRVYNMFGSRVTCPKCASRDVCVGVE